MKLTTDFWGTEKFDFNNLLFVRVKGNKYEVVYEANLSSKDSTYNFFKTISKFILSKDVMKTIYANGWRGDEYFQFAVRDKGEIILIKWFDLKVNDKTTLSHDIAFETTMIRKNDILVPLGSFPMHRKSNAKKKMKRILPKYREFNLKSRAYKYIANQVKKNFE